MMPMSQSITSSEWLKYWYHLRVSTRAPLACSSFSYHRASFFGMFRASMVLLYVAWLEPPRPMGLLLALISTTFAPSSAAALATVRPPVPAPTTTMSASTVSAMSVMGASGTSKLHLPK